MGLRLFLYFLLGGSIVTLVTYFGSHGKGIMAAFVATFPTMTVTTIITIYLASGAGASTSYVKGLLLMMPSWFAYSLSILFLIPRLGLGPALVIGVSLYVTGTLITMRLVQ